MQGRSISSEQYRYGFNGQEKDDDVASDGVYTTYFRMEDTRIGKWWSIDPKATPYESPYAMMGNSPIIYMDPLGDKVNVTELINSGEVDGKAGVYALTRVISDLEVFTGIKVSVEEIVAPSGEVSYWLKGDYSNAYTEGGDLTDGARFLKTVLEDRYNNIKVNALYKDDDTNSDAEGDGSQIRLGIRNILGDIHALKSAGMSERESLTWGFGAVFLHEVRHTKSGIYANYGVLVDNRSDLGSKYWSHPKTSAEWDSRKDATMWTINKFRSDIGLPLRLNYNVELNTDSYPYPFILPFGFSVGKTDFSMKISVADAYHTDDKDGNNRAETEITNYFNVNANDDPVLRLRKK